VPPRSGCGPARARLLEFEIRYHVVGYGDTVKPSGPSLADLTVRDVAVIEHVGGEGAFRRRLMELGLVPGTRVELVGVAPLGDPLELLVRGSSLSIRKSEASVIRVAGLTPTAATEQATGRADLEPVAARGGS